jgi:hypothetical protein
VPPRDCAKLRNSSLIAPAARTRSPFFESLEEGGTSGTGWAAPQTLPPLATRPAARPLDRATAILDAWAARAYSRNCPKRPLCPLPPREIPSRHKPTISPEIGHFARV